MTKSRVGQGGVTDRATDARILNSRYEAKRKFMEENKFHKFLVRMLHNTEYSLREISIITKVHEDTLSNIARGKTPGSVATWSKIIDGLDIELAYRFKPED